MDTIENEKVILKSEDDFSIISVQTGHGLCEVHYDSQHRSKQHPIEVSVNVPLIHEVPRTNNDVIILATDHSSQPQIRIDVHFLLPIRD